jgi:hypothetical protein
MVRAFQAQCLVRNSLQLAGNEVSGEASNVNMVKVFTSKNSFLIYVETSNEMPVALPLMHALPCLSLILILLSKETSEWCQSAQNRITGKTLPAR